MTSILPRHVATPRDVSRPFGSDRDSARPPNRGGCVRPLDVQIVLRPARLGSCRSLTGALVQCPHMTKLLTEVIRQIVELPEERQDDAARVLMLMLEHDPEQYRLSDEQLREVDEAIADVDAGNFASDQDIDRVLHRSWA